MFDMMKRSHARHYVEGLREADLSLHKFKFATYFQAKVDESGTLVLSKDSSPITFNRHTFLRMPPALVNLGFPQTVMMLKGETFQYTSVMWAFIDDDARSDLLATLEGDHEILMLTFRGP